MAGPELFDPLVAPFSYDADGRDGVVLIHGWTGSPAHFRMLGADLAGAGYAVEAPLLPGHGTSVERLASATWRDWIREAASAAWRLVEAGKRVHLVGLSMGGLIALLTAPSMEAASVSTINAALHVRSRTMWMSPLFRGWATVRPQAERELPDEDALPYFKQYDGNPIGSAADLRDLMRAARRNLGAVTCPALVIQSRADQTVDPRSGLAVYQGISSADKQMLWLEHARHNSLLDDERPLIHDAIVGRIASAT